MAPATAAAFVAYFVVIAGIGYASLRRTHGFVARAKLFSATLGLEYTTALWIGSPPSWRR